MNLAGAEELARFPRRVLQTSFTTSKPLSSTMPQIFEKEGFRFFFYSNDHRPIHVHVRKGNGEAIFNVEDEVDVRESHGFKPRELARARELAEENRRRIIRFWHEHLG
ncbi:MAG TPA: DUF4160 domain-containing protein [Chthoniobacterales bacterium]